MIVTLFNPKATSDEVGHFTVTCSLDEAFALLSMPAFDRCVVSLFPEYTDDLPAVLAEEKE